MSSQPIVMTELDHSRLESLLEKLRERPKNSAGIEVLEQELDRAQVVDPSKVPPDVVTMNSRVALLDLDTGEEMNVQLVFPAAANLAEGQISILAPVALALLGYRAGDEITWPVPSGTRRLRIEEVIYQPEAAGRYDL
jgi:regulator of nucleoside diphosphate kinase